MTSPLPTIVSPNYVGKRLFDTTAATIGIAVLGPILVLAALAVAVSSRGPILFTAVRVGRNGKPIKVHKFRSMRQSSNGPAITSSHDPRVTATGRVLRSLKIDELPQLFDVMVGSMSLVGPRPEDPRYVERYDDAQRVILTWRPGITSPASIRYRHEEQLLAAAHDVDAAYLAVSRDKIAIDVEYFRDASFRGDLGVIARTLGVILQRSEPLPSKVRATS